MIPEHSLRPGALAEIMLLNPEEIRVDTGTAALGKLVRGLGVPWVFPRAC